jgi:OPT family oligopeptide transporter
MAVSMSIFFTLPIGVLAATTNRFTGVGSLCDVLTGYLLPGFPMANVVFRMYSAEAIAHGLAFLRDFKLGHYMKIPPRSMLAVQVSGSIIGGLVNMICAYWMFNNIDGLCEEAGAWSCPATTNSFSVVSLWGLVGSSRLIGAYKALNWFIVGGLLAPIPFWLISKSFRSRNIQEYSKRVNMPVLLGAANQWPPAIAVSYTSWFLTGFIFNYCIFKYRQRWWQRYNYVLSAALDTGVAFAGPLIFFTLLYGNKSGPKWWGNPDQYIDHCPLAFCPTAPGINVTNQYPFCPVH